MTKKDFISLADTFKQCPELHNTKYLLNMADDLEKRYSKFNKKLWLAYIRGECGSNGGKIKNENKS